jgi:hypothetical protein
VSRLDRVGLFKYYFELGASIFPISVSLLFPAVEKGLWEILFFWMATVG